MKGKKITALMLTGTLGLTTLAGVNCQAEESADGYPSDTVTGIVQWGEGGGTDTLMRPLANLAESPLGVSIEIENMAGNSGADATEYVYEQEADGYTLLMGAENPTLYEALELSDLTYDDFEPIIIIGDETVGIIVGKDSTYTNLTDLINDALDAPGTLKLASTGTGGLPWEVAAMLTAVTGATFEEVIYDSDASAKKAVVSGECDFTVCKLQIGIDDHNNGELSYISMLATEPVEGLEGIPLITEEYPEFEEYLPWGPFYGVFVKTGTDQEVIDTLTEAFTVAYEDAAYQDMIGSLDINGLGYTGEEAEEYVLEWQERTVQALVESGEEAE